MSSKIAIPLKRSRRIIGLLDRLVAANELMPAVLRYATDLVQNVSPRSVRVLKEQLWAALFQSLSEAVLLANREMFDSTQSKGFKEGLAI